MHTTEFSKSLAVLIPHLRMRALRLTRADAAADDLVQDTLVRAMTFASQYQGGTNLKAWASQILFSVFISRYRKMTRETRALKALSSDPEGWTQRDAFLAPDLETSLSGKTQEKLNALPEGFRTVITLVDLESRSYRDAAKSLRVPVGTVMSRLHRGRKLLSAMIEREAA
jgi:RNA polymerase sigma-70 factor, ECF subfamily